MHDNDQMQNTFFKCRATDGCIFKCAGLRRELARKQATFLTCMGQGKATGSLIPATALGMKTAFIRCVTEMDVTVLLSLAGLLGDMSSGVHLHKWARGHSPGPLGFTLRHGVHASSEAT